MNILDLNQRTPLTPEEEDAFQKWYAEVSARSGLGGGPDDPRHAYDWRGAYKSGAAPVFMNDGQLHWPSKFKADTHPDRYIKGIDTKTGKRRGTPNR